MPTRDVNIWEGRSSENIYDNSSRGASDGPRSPSPVAGHRSTTSTSSASSSTTESESKSSGGSESKRGQNPRSRFSFSTGTIENIKTPPPPAPTIGMLCAPDTKRNSIFPVGWLVGTVVRDVYTAISQWILNGISAWLLQRSFLGSVRRQVFRDLRHRLKTGPLSILVTPPPADEVTPSKPSSPPPDRDMRKSKTLKLISEPESNLLLMGGGGSAGLASPLVAPDETVAVDDGSSHTVQWVIFAIEVMALIPIVVIGLSLFYILAVGIYNDVQDLLRRLFGERDDDSATGGGGPPAASGDM